MGLGIKEETKELESLLKITKPIEQAVIAPAVDSAPEELGEPEPLFTIDYEKEKKRLMKRARATVKKLVRLIIPPQMIEDDFVKDKIEQDADQLSSLYWQKECIEIMQKTLMETVSHGNASPRYFETFSQISKNHSDIADQISKFETFIRKNYTDIKYDIKDREDELNLLGGASQVPQLESKKQDDGGILITSTKDFIKNAKEEKIKFLKAKNQKDDVLDVDEVK